MMKMFHKFDEDEVMIENVASGNIPELLKWC